MRVIMNQFRLKLNKIFIQKMSAIKCLQIKIGIIIACQISIIVASFLILVFFENQSTYLGNTIDISGKNRFFAEFLYAKTINYVLRDNQIPPYDVINNIDNNIQILSNGGHISDASAISDTMVMAVPSAFANDMNKLENKWTVYKTGITDELDSKTDKIILNDPDLDKKRSDFVSAADNLTNDLAKFHNTQTVNQIILQLAFLGINVIAHLLLLRMIFKIIRQDQTRKLLIQQISSDKKQLLFETKISILQKDILEAFLIEMEKDLQKLNEQVRIMNDSKQAEKNKSTIQEIFQSLLVQIQQLAQSKKEWEDQKSYYSQLNRKIEKTLSILSKNDNDLTQVKSTADLISIIQSYVEIVNSLIYTQRIPAKLGKNLTDAMNEIIDHLILKNRKIES